MIWETSQEVPDETINDLGYLDSLREDPVVVGGAQQVSAASTTSSGGNISDTLEGPVEMAGSASDELTATLSIRPVCCSTDPPIYPCGTEVDSDEDDDMPRASTGTVILEVYCFPPKNVLILLKYTSVFLRNSTLLLIKYPIN